MSLIIKPKALTNGTIGDATEVESDLNTIYNDYNGNITNDNISASAGIVDTKLNQISTASKVNGSAIIGLASIQSSAGYLPPQNVQQLAVLTTAGIGAIPYFSSIGTMGVLVSGASGTYLMSTSTTSSPVWNNPSTGSYDSGYFAVAVNSSYPLAHSLGTTKFISRLFYSPFANGDSAMECSKEGDWGYGGSITHIDTTGLKVQTDNNGVCGIMMAGVASTFAAGYYRVLLLKL